MKINLKRDSKGNIEIFLWKDYTVLVKNTLLCTFITIINPKHYDVPRQGPRNDEHCGGCNRSRPYPHGVFV